MGDDPAISLGKRNVGVLIQGLDGSGKTTILNKIQLGEVRTTAPTIGFNVEKFEYRDILFTAWDMGGSDRIRSLHPHFYQNAQALIYVIDSADCDRLEIASQELNNTLCERELRDVPLLVFLNKRDLPNPLSAQKVIQSMKLDRMRSRRWYVQPCCATTGDGLFEGLHWLSLHFKSDESPAKKTKDDADMVADFTLEQVFDNIESDISAMTDDVTEGVTTLIDGIVNIF